MIWQLSLSTHCQQPCTTTKFNGESNQPVPVTARGPSRPPSPSTAPGRPCSTKQYYTLQPNLAVSALAPFTPAVPPRCRLLGGYSSPPAVSSISSVAHHCRRAMLHRCCRAALHCHGTTVLCCLPQYICGLRWLCAGCILASGTLLAPRCSAPACR